MFDDLKQDQSQDQTSAQPSAVPPPTPAKPAVDDMFSSTDPAPAQVLEKPSAVQSGLVKPVQSTELPKPTMQDPVPNKPSGPLPPANMAMASNGGGGFKKILIILVAVILVAAVSYGVYYFFFRNSGQPTSNENQNTQINSNEDLSQNTNTNIQEELDDDSDGLSNAEEALLGTNPLETDTDNDGLFDREEVRSFKTDPTKADSDNDGLSDYNEIKKWFTDPLKQDTDGDGFGDGEEVLNQYDPLGPGKLENSEGDITYVEYTDETFGFSIEVPEEWVDIYKNKQEPTPITSFDFMPHIGSSEYITVKVISANYDDQAAFKSILPVDSNWVDYDLNGQIAYKSSDNTRVMFYIPNTLEGEDGHVYTIAYEGWELSSGVYMGVFQYMLDSFYFLNN